MNIDSFFVVSDTYLGLAEKVRSTSGTNRQNEAVLIILRVAAGEVDGVLLANEMIDGFKKLRCTIFSAVV